MARFTALLFLGFLLTFDNKPMAFGQNDWLNDLLAKVRDSNEKLQSNMQQMSEQIRFNISKQLELTNRNVENALKSANEATKNIPKGSSIVSAGSGQTIFVSSSAGSSHQVHSGTDPDGKPYYIESENAVVDKTLFHTDRVYNYATKKFDEKRYTLDLSDPNAKPIYS